MNIIKSRSGLFALLNKGIVSALFLITLVIPGCKKTATTATTESEPDSRPINTEANPTSGWTQTSRAVPRATRNRARRCGGRSSRHPPPRVPHYARDDVSTCELRSV